MPTARRGYTRTRAPSHEHAHVRVQECLKTSGAASRTGSSGSPHTTSQQSESQDLAAALTNAQAEVMRLSAIVDELNSVQGQPVDIQGYFHPNRELASQAMRPSKTLNDALAMVSKG